MDIETLAAALNAACRDFDIGRIQDLRVRLRGLSRSPCSGIFDSRTINKEYAFHVGGRSELQFNIGNEQRAAVTGVRFGVAFSLEPSRSLPTIEPLLPRIARFNDYLRANPTDFPALAMWSWLPDGTRIDRPVAPIESIHAVVGTFIFLGRWVPWPQVDVRAILADFDRLLPLYRHVEAEHELGPATAAPGFSAGCPDFTSPATTRASVDSLDVALHHHQIQNVLHECLCRESGADNVKTEHSLDLGVRVDAAVRSGRGLAFYEVKIAATAQACLRQALGQLMEYAYWPAANRALELVVVGEPPVGELAGAYLRLLRERFGLPIWYRQINLADGALGPAT